MEKVNHLKIRTTLLFFCFLTGLYYVSAQSTIYSEDFGSPTANTLIQDYTGWQNTQVHYSGNGTCDVRSSSASTGYGLASGGGNVLINDTVKWFMISGLHTATDTNLSLYCGLRKVTAENGSNFVVEVSTDSLQWTRLWFSDTLPTGTGTSGWHRVRYPAVPSCNYLHIRFSNASGAEYRLDDVAVVVGEESELQTVAMPVFSPAGGTYYEDQTVSITCGTADASIYYTMDGTTPTINSDLYQGTLIIHNTTTIKAVAVHDNMYNSEVATANYIIQDTNSLVTLPLDLSTNSSNEQQDITLMSGFRGYYLGSSYADGSAKFESGQAGRAMLVAHLDSAPDQLEFDLKGRNGGSNPSDYTGVSLEVAESADGQNWQPVVTLTENDIAITDYVHFNGYTLQSSTRYVRWKLLAAEKGNTQLNNIVITKYTNTPGDNSAVLDYQARPVSLYPNPTTGTIYLDAGTRSFRSLILLSINGKELMRWENPPTSQIDIGHLAQGIYILKMVTSEGTVQKKVVRY